MRATAVRSLTPLGVALFGMALITAGCGGSSDSTSPTGEAAAPSAKSFPSPAGRTLEQIAADEGAESDLVVAPASQVFHQGENRFGFGVFTVSREPVTDAEVALYVARPDEPARGPYPASTESLAVDAPFQSRSTSTDPDAAQVVYAAAVDFGGKGEWRILALVKEGGGYSYTPVPSAVVDAFPQVPKEGRKAPIINTPTADDVGGDLSQIDTRQPPSTMHEDDFADAIGKEPIVLLFATPALCSSRVCGPVVDIAEQVKAERGDEAAFIMQEIYKDNMVDKGLREQVKTYRLPSEPWLFVIGTDGKISTEIEGAFSEGELNAALDKVSTQSG